LQLWTLTVQIAKTVLLQLLAELRACLQQQTQRKKHQELTARKLYHLIVAFAVSFAQAELGLVVGKLRIVIDRQTAAGCATQVPISAAR
jgi:hypothetical protein